MTKLSDEELIKAAHESAAEFLKNTDPSKMFILEERICILHFSLPKILWYSLESYCKLEGISVNEFLTIYCNNYLFEQHRKITLEAVKSAGL